MRNVILLSLCLAAGCADVDYTDTKAGKFDGEVAVVWLRGTEGSGDGTFVYVPTPKQPLTFIRPEGETAGHTIVPEMMYTDGGSVPPIFRVFKGLTPWNYGPAYIVHDWLFVARQCLNADRTDPEYAALAELTFQDSAEIIAESIKALETSGRISRGDVSGAAVTAAVTSPFSKALWQKAGCREVSDLDRRLALEAVGRNPEIGRTSPVLMLRDSKGGPARPASAVVVAISSFD